MSSYSGIFVTDPELEGHFTQVELRSYKNKFDSLQTGSEPFLTRKDMKSGYVNLGFQFPLTDSLIHDILNEFDINRKGALDFEGYLRLQLDLSKSDSKFKDIASPNPTAEKRAFMRSSISGSVHRINDSERRAYVEHINRHLAEDNHLQKVLPINPANNDVFEIVKDGILLCKLINAAVPKTIDERAINIKENLNPWEKNENHTLCLNSLKAIGCAVVNIGTQDLIEGRAHLVLGLIAQLVKIQLLSVVSVEKTPELAEILNEDEEVEDMAKLSSEAILLRWMNYHLQKAKFKKEIKNFSSDLKDGEAYAVLLHQLAPDECEDIRNDGEEREKEKEKGSEILRKSEANALIKAEQILQQAEKIDCAKYIQPADLVNGSHDLNLAFVANLFKTRNGLPKKKSGVTPEVIESGEERMFRMWINSVGISSQVTNLIEDLRDGYVLLEVLDKVVEGSVNWKRVYKPPVKMRIKQIENCSQVLEIAKEIDLSIISITGSDIVDGNKKLILGYLGQLMRYNMLLMLMNLRNDHEVSENDILSWANEMVSSSGKQTSMSNFKDKSLSSGLFFLDLLASIEPHAINQAVIKPGLTDAEKLKNANYIISVARKLGCSIFISPTDIVEVRPKMIFMLTASIMVFYLTKKQKSNEQGNGGFTIKRRVEEEIESREAIGSPSATTPKQRKSFASMVTPIRAFISMRTLRNSPSPASVFRSSVSSPNIFAQPSSHSPARSTSPSPFHSTHSASDSDLASRPDLSDPSLSSDKPKLSSDFKSKLSIFDDTTPVPASSAFASPATNVASASSPVVDVVNSAIFSDATSASTIDPPEVDISDFPLVASPVHVATISGAGDVDNDADEDVPSLAVDASSDIADISDFIDIADHAYTSDIATSSFGDDDVDNDVNANYERDDIIRNDDSGGDADAATTFPIKYHTDE